jgi:recombination protein RecA
MIEIAPPSNAKELKAVTDEAIKTIEKEHGKGAIGRLGDKPTQEVPHIPFGIDSLDKGVLGVGGLPRGRIIEIYGPESSGKTTLALLAVAAAQKMGMQAAFIDVEHALDPNWAQLNGVDISTLLVSQPDYGEQALQIVEVLVGTGACGIIVVDSVAALVPKSELEGEIGDSSMGVQARMMSQAMRKLTGIVSKSNTTLVFINQIRDKIGVVYGSPEVTTGGRALKFFASVRLDVRRIAAIKNAEEIVGNKIKIKAAKNKVGKPYGECELELLFNRGFDLVGPIFDKAVFDGRVEKAGSWYSYQGERIGQGRDNAISTLISTGNFDSLTLA